MEPEPLRGVLGPERPDRIGGHRRRRRHLGQQPTVWPPKLERAVGPGDNLVALLMHRPVMAATQ